MSIPLELYTKIPVSKCTNWRSEFNRVCFLGILLAMSAFGEPVVFAVHLQDMDMMRHRCPDCVLYTPMAVSAEEPALTICGFILRCGFENGHGMLVLNAADGGARAL